jgi:predicted DNA-binding transcriptional regulator AlpA
MKTAVAPTLDVIFRAAVRDVVVEVLDEAIDRLGPRPVVVPALLDREGLANALGVSLPTVDKLKRKKDFPNIRVMDAPRFDLAEVRAFLRAQPVESEEAK